MSNTFVDSVPFYSQDLCTEGHYAYDSFSMGKCQLLEKDDGNLTSECLPQDENKYTKQNNPAKQTASRKRESSNILVDCVKRRDNFRNIDLISNVPCESFDLLYGNMLSKSVDEGVDEKVCSIPQECVAASLPNMDFSDSSSSVTDSGFDSSKSSSPVHHLDTPSCLEKDICEIGMDVDAIENASQKLVSEEKPCPKSITSIATEDLCSLHLSDPSTADGQTATARSPFIESLFKNMPSMIYFSTKDEAVSAMPDQVVPLLKWKLSVVTPVVIKEVVLKTGYSLLETDTTDDWIGTWGKHLKCKTFKKIKHFQKVNHFPGGFHLGRKDRLWENYNKMQNKHGEDVFNFFPETYILPADLKALKQAWGDHVEKCWIVKPCASARGTGVKVIYKWCQVPKNSPFVVQRYISDPYLINGSKFDLRLYILISSLEPLRVYLFEDGLVRFASEKYSLANKSFSNRYIHLTNYSINRKSSSYTSNDDETMCQGHKWSLRSFWTYMSNSGINVAKIQETITDMVVKTVISTEGPICRMLKVHAKNSYNCFELFGFDIMLDKNLQPWLLEVNISPSLHTKSLLDSNVKGPLVKDMLNVAGFEIPKKSSDPNDDSISSSVGNRHKPVRNRWLSHDERRKHAFYTYKHAEAEFDILKSLTMDDLYCLMESEDELQRRGSFRRVFPTHETHKYFVYFDHIRYYNVLLDTWERTFHANRTEGVKFLQDVHNNLTRPSLKSEETPDVQDPVAVVKSSEPVLTIIEH